MISAGLVLVRAASAGGCGHLREERAASHLADHQALPFECLQGPPYRAAGGGQALDQDAFRRQFGARPQRAVAQPVAQEGPQRVLNADHVAIVAN